MAISLASISRARRMQAPRVVVYGPQKIGKTTFAASAPASIVIQTEDGLAALNVDAFPLAKSYNDVLEAIGVLYSDEHPFQTVVIDSLDWLEPMVWAETCRAHDKKSIEDFGYGKGFTMAATYWSQILDGLNALRDKGMAVILLAHHEIKRFDAPDTDPFDRYQIKLHKSAAALIQEWADVIGFANFRTVTKQAEVGFNKKVTRGIGTGERLLHLVETPAFVAGNRYNMPASIPLSWDAFIAAMNVPAATKQTAA